MQKMVTINFEDLPNYALSLNPDYFRPLRARSALFGRCRRAHCGAALAESGAHPLSGGMGFGVDTHPCGPLLSVHLPSAFARFVGGRHPLAGGCGDGAAGVVGDADGHRRAHAHQRRHVALPAKRCQNAPPARMAATLCGRRRGGTALGGDAARRQTNLSAAQCAAARLGGVSLHGRCGDGLDLSVFQCALPPLSAHRLRAFLHRLVGLYAATQPSLPQRTGTRHCPQHARLLSRSGSHRAVELHDVLPRFLDHRTADAHRDGLFRGVD